jgi:hypothetical protein
MKASVVAIGLAVALFGTWAQAQEKGPRSYFPKKYPAPPPGGAAAGSTAPNGATGAAAAPKPPPPPPVPKFKDVGLNSQFFFISDTNHAFPWVKVSTSTATNVKNGVVRPINAETPVQK